VDEDESLVDGLAKIEEEQALIVVVPSRSPIVGKV
jgi:hypothetical protein